MITQQKDEERIDYLIRVLEAFMAEYGYNSVEYDETTCDGMCLAEDIKNEVESL